VRNRVEDAVLGPQRRRGLTGAAVDGRPVLGGKLRDLDVVLKGADPIGEPLDRGSDLVSLAHLRYSLPSGAVVLTGRR
jgi:hypothetical protein